MSLNSCHLWWLHTAGAAQALGLAGTVGNLVPGAEADFVVLDPQATPLLARRTAAARSLDGLLFAFVILADDRAVVDTFFASKCALPQYSEQYIAMFINSVPIFNIDGST